MYKRFMKSKKTKLKMKGLIKKIWQPVCGWCQLQPAQEAGLCIDCYQTLPWIDQACTRCGYPTALTASQCQRCHDKAFAFDQVKAPLRYQWPVDHMIKQLKKKGRLFYGRWLANCLVNYVKKHGFTQPDCVIVMPLHTSRLVERGFNQCTEIARPLVKQLGLSLEWTLCEKLKSTARQSQLKAADRQRNVDNAFTITRSVEDQRIVVIEDVITTGQTAHQLAKALKAKGANHVEFWCCATAVKD